MMKLKPIIESHVNTDQIALLHLVEALGNQHTLFAGRDKPFVSAMSHVFGLTFGSDVIVLENAEGFMACCPRSPGGGLMLRFTITNVAEQRVSVQPYLVDMEPSGSPLQKDWSQTVIDAFEQLLFRQCIEAGVAS